MKVLIIYISTGIYNDNYNDFYNSINNFLPNIEKKVLSISDISHKADYQYIISDGPWPIVALLKFHYIYEALKTIDLTDITYIFYINADGRFLEKTNEYNNKFINIMNNNDLIFMNHALNDTPTYKNYIHAAFFGGNTKAFLELCEIHNERTYNNLHLNFIPKFHDETVVNTLYNNGSLLSYKINIDHYGIPNLLSTSSYYKKLINTYKDKALLQLMCTTKKHRKYVC